MMQGKVLELDAKLRRVYNHPAALKLHHERKLQEPAEGGGGGGGGASSSPWWAPLWPEGRAGAGEGEAGEPAATASHLSGKTLVTLAILRHAVEAGEKARRSLHCTSPSRGRGRGPNTVAAGEKATLIACQHRSFYSLPLISFHFSRSRSTRPCPL